MAIVPADAIVLVPCLAELLQNLPDRATLPDPVAFDDH
jgi:hypothetical protein